MMNVDKWIVALQHPLVLAGFGLFLFASLIKPLFLNNKKLTGTATERLLVRGMNFAFVLALLAIMGGLLLSWKDGGKVIKPAAESNSTNQAVINNNGPGTVTVNNYGLSKEQYAEERQKLADELVSRLRNADDKNRLLLEQKLKAVQEQLDDTKKSYEENRRLLQEAYEKLELLKKQYPKIHIEKALARLEQGDTEAAEQLFDTVANKGGAEAASAAYQSGQLAAGRMDYEKALWNYKKAVELQPDNPDYLLAAGQMARTVADYAQSEKLLKKLLRLKEEKNKDDEQLSDVLNELALLYRLQGQYAEAEPLMKRSLAIKEKVLGPAHPSLVLTLNNLMVLYEAQGQYEKLEAAAQRALTICEKSVGRESICTASALHNLVGAYFHQGRYAESEQLYKRALDIKERIFGADHPNVAMTLTGLANLYARQGRYAEADSLYKRSLEIDEKTLGKDHPSVAGILGCLAGSYSAQGRYNEAGPLYQRAIAIIKKKFPNGHPYLDQFQKNYDALKEKMKERQGKFMNNRL